ncbi:response regulator [Mesorhizobium sp. M4B.F.Ca.ET.215.01.1.1]|uniref:HAMP domain-containing protein n=2 Tax=Mesorhizobium TaxID=68287 RepID=UPI000FCABFB9|nr:MULTISPECIES: HAMP domain-containing protein [unclassified Mesorhizobium]RUW74877.1 response regulator [Mesorhizobium sp. M4B.F.Ca.ET.049.02.1.2]TGV24906.1 response regulator [Mesorhizobium sp. M4B.F.Ca.ET.143.01.1.1]RUW23114.1 response regulator [Mesorhizobium sp. M4B.F.Ca.ET.013.02.1.1]RVD39940.1 response regulator [Mesorhizobium sp. M4B.F.Ca.ET.019.03.1.1]TGQ05414.1 response regulator [Mesorhizobium sp. M4B.F.Ca.ET.215.01.1.1]
MQASRAQLDRRQILNSLKAFRRGDFSVRIDNVYEGIDSDIADAFNQIVELNDQVTKEFERLSRVVGKDGRIGERGHVRNATGSWESSVRSVNDLIEDMVQPTAEVARVIGAVAKGDLSQTMMVEIDGRPLRGEFLRIGKIVNTMVGQLASFASEVTRVAREVGTEGKLGGQARVKGVAGTWKDLTDNVNAMATNLTGQVRNIAEVTTAVASGDLSKKITVDVKGEILELKNTINTMVDQLNSFASEVTRVAREVGTEGKLGGQARVEGVGGTWKDLTDNVNSMAENLTGQVRNIAEVTTAVALGDLSKKITVDVKGEILELKNTINTMVDQLNSFASEVTRVAREVGTEGKLGGQAQVRGVAGTWKDLTDNVNSMAENLTGQVRNIAEVTTAVASGDLSKKITVAVQGEILELKDTINTMVDQLNSFASEVTRVAREVGTEGKLGGQAEVKGVAGTWKDLTDNVNLMAANLTGQVRNIAEVTTAVARGDLSKKITVDVKGEILELKDTVNTMVDQLNSFASEVTRVAREVGSEGKLGGQAHVEGVGGTWKDLTDNVNAMAGNLTVQLRDVSKVATAIATGDLTQKITVDALGEILQIKDVINTMVDQLNSFASEVTRVAREVGSDGKLGGQAQVRGVAGTWKDLTDNVNAMAANLTGQVRNIADVTTAVALGDLSKKITVDVKGEILELKSTINTMVDQLNSFAGEVTRVAREVGTEGKLGGQAQVRGVAGTWKDLTDNVNSMAENLTGQVRNIAEVTTAVARGDLSKKITVDVKGEILELKSTINTMVDQLNSFAGEVTRVAREVGTEGKLGGQAEVRGVAGTWKDLTDNVNLMATNLTNQVRGIADVVTAVAQGNLKRKLTVDAKGEIASLADTINGMIETLATFADQVTNVAREVGIEGKLGGQARVPGAAGLWRDLTDNVNQLAANLTTQVRAIAEVSTAVTKGDLTRSISVEASGEVAALKDNINEMIRNLKDQTLKNAEQDWLKTNLARFSRMLQGERDLATVSRLIMSELAPLVNAQYGVFYVTNRDEDESYLELAASYGAESKAAIKQRLDLREGLVGQSAADKRAIMLDNVPPDFLRVTSGLGSSSPANVIILPALFEDEVKAVIELASFGEFRDTHQSFLNQLMESVGIVLNTIAATMRTEGLLKQSQLLTSELQARQTELTKKQEELHATNEELQEKAQLLENEKKQVENKNLEIEMARRALEEKAEQLALTSKYKSEFLANMSHELRTPLNSLLILSNLLATNQQGNLNDKQVEFARTINSAGTDLLSLINDILDLSKIESGTVSIDINDMPVAHLRQHMERTFRQLAADKGLGFAIKVDPALPETVRTDEKRLQQIVLNLLSNAFKFTSGGQVSLNFRLEKTARRNGARQSARALAIAVTDTGIGIPEDKQKLIFEAFQQADGTTSRKYGGTGLGLSISREIARLLGGELRVESTPGKGSTFTLVIPIDGPRTTAATQPELLPATEAIATTAAPTGLPSAELMDDRDAISAEDRVVLIVEDDPTFGGLLLGLARSAGLKGVLSTAGSGTLALARKLVPDAITLDLGLADIDGWVLFDLLRHDPKTTGIPIHVISGADDIEGLATKGASSISTKPVSSDELMKVFQDIHSRKLRVQRRVLVADADPERRLSLVETIRDGVTSVTAIGRAATADDIDLAAYDAVVLGLGRSAKDNAQALDELTNQLSDGLPPLLFFAPHSDAIEQVLALNPAWIDVPRAENFAQLALHISATLPGGLREDNGAGPGQAENRSNIAGAKVLIVDDDIRNIYSLTSVLETYDIEVLHAERGRDGIALLEENSDVDAALIDIMMPEMDGYETMRRIRNTPAIAHIPLISVTAKAMKGDRQKCLEAGASDYIAKPVDLDLLMALLRVWIGRSRARVETSQNLLMSVN